MMQFRRLEIRIPAEMNGWRVGKAIRQSFRLSGTLLRRIKWLEDGILLDNQRVTVRQTVYSGQLLSVRVGEDEAKSGIVPAPGLLEILYEDEDILILNKQAGVLSHPGHGHFDDTLGNFVMHYYKISGIAADYHPVHRLDKGTTGLMVIAKHIYAQECLRQSLHTADFRRIYLAICDGVPTPLSGVIEKPIRKVEGSLLKREVGEGGQEARTSYKTISVYQNRGLVQLELDTGRTHQIRVHMACIGCPLTGDYLYGQEDQNMISRPALHSSELILRHPVTGQMLHISCPLPADMEKLCSL